jgi:hypothetical protein
MGKLIVECWKEDIWLKLLTLTSILLIVIAFFIPHMAVVDGSILAAVGELTGIGALWQFTKAINKNIDAKVKIKEIELELNNKDDDDPGQE